MINIISRKGDKFVFDEDTELISMNGVIVPYSDYQPVYVRNEIREGNIPPSFIGILNVGANEIITLNGNINKLINDESEIDI